MAVGSYAPSHKNAELYNFGTEAWKTVESYPFGSDSLQDSEILYIPVMSAFLIIGGSDSSDDTSQIAKFKDGTWFDAGHLKRARRVSFCSLLFLN